jgi:hypothetical protein
VVLVAQSGGRFLERTYFLPCIMKRRKCLVTCHPSPFPKGVHSRIAGVSTVKSVTSGNYMGCMNEKYFLCLGVGGTQGILTLRRPMGSGLPKRVPVTKSVDVQEQETFSPVYSNLPRINIGNLRRQCKLLTSYAMHILPSGLRFVSCKIIILVIGMLIGPSAMSINSYYYYY